jgi:HipA-like protein
MQPPSDSLRSVCATRYVAPLREGGSLPGLVEADDDGMYVMKFRGAGQGVAALVAEVVAGELARSLGLLVPELVVAWLEPELARAEPDVEIQELAAASVGANLGVDFLPGALPFTPAASSAMDPDLAAQIVWLDALVMNVDRTPRNPNLLAWHGRVWLIDHGAAFYRQHGDAPLAESAHTPFAHIRDHVLLGRAGSIMQADKRLAGPASEAISRSVAVVPDTWLGDDPPRRRADFEAFLRERLTDPRSFVEEAENARAA